MSIGNQAVAHKDTIVLSIIQGDSQAGVQSAALLVIIHLNALVQWSRKPRMQSGMNPLGTMMMTSGTALNGTLKRMKRPRERKVKGTDLSLKEIQRQECRDLSLQGRRSLHLRRVIDPNPKPNPKHEHA